MCVDLLSGRRSGPVRQRFVSSYGIADIRLHENIRTEGQQVRAPLGGGRQFHETCLGFHGVLGNVLLELGTLHLVTQGGLNSEAASKVELVDDAGLIQKHIFVFFGVVRPADGGKRQTAFHAELLGAGRHHRSEKGGNDQNLFHTSFNLSG